MVWFFFLGAVFFYHAFFFSNLPVQIVSMLIICVAFFSLSLFGLGLENKDESPYRVFFSTGLTFFLFLLFSLFPLYI